MENHFERKQSAFEMVASTVWGWVFIFVVFALFVVWTKSSMEISPATEEKLVPGLHHTAPSSKQ